MLQSIGKSAARARYYLTGLFIFVFPFFFLPLAGYLPGLVKAAVFFFFVSAYIFFSLFVERNNRRNILAWPLAILLLAGWLSVLFSLDWQAALFGRDYEPTDSFAFWAGIFWLVFLLISYSRSDSGLASPRLNQLYFLGAGLAALFFLLSVLSPADSALLPAIDHAQGESFGLFLVFNLIILSGSFFFGQESRPALSGKLFLLLILAAALVLIGSKLTLVILVVGLLLLLNVYFFRLKGGFFELKPVYLFLPAAGLILTAIFFLTAPANRLSFSQEKFGLNSAENNHHLFDLSLAERIVAAQWRENHIWGWGSGNLEYILDKYAQGQAEAKFPRFWLAFLAEGGLIWSLSYLLAAMSVIYLLIIFRQAKRSRFFSIEIAAALSLFFASHFFFRYNVYILAGLWFGAAVIIYYFEENNSVWPQLQARSLLEKIEGGGISLVSALFLVLFFSAALANTDRIISFYFLRQGDEASLIKAAMLDDRNSIVLADLAEFYQQKVRTAQGAGNFNPAHCSDCQAALNWGVAAFSVYPYSVRRAEYAAGLYDEYCLAGAYDACLENLNWNRKILELDPANLAAAKQLAKLYFWQKNYSDAARYYRLAEQLDPTAGNPLGLAKSLARSGAESEAAEILIDLKQEDPRNLAVWYESGRMNYARSRFQEAEADFSQALELDPQDSSALYGLGAVYLAEGQTEKSLDYFHQAWSFDLNNEALQKKIKEVESYLAGRKE